MKKFLFSLAVLLPALAANAQEVTDFFKVTYNDKVLNDGDIVYVTPNYDAPDVEEGRVTYTPHIKMINLEKDPRQVEASLLFVKPSVTFYEENAYNEDVDYLYGFPQICYAGGLADNLEDTIGNCLSATPGVNAGTGKPIVPGAGNDTFQWDIDLFDADPEVTTEMALQLYAQEGYGLYGENITDPFTIVLIFSTTDSGVENVGVDLDAPAEYYDLQGRKVVNPAAGIYIVKQGNKVTKCVIR